MAQKYCLIQKAGPMGREAVISATEFDTILDADYEVIIFVASDGRFSASIYDWLDYGSDEQRGLLQVRVLPRSHLVRS